MDEHVRVWLSFWDRVMLAREYIKMLRDAGEDVDSYTDVDYLCVAVSFVQHTGEIPLMVEEIS